MAQDDATRALSEIAVEGLDAILLAFKRLAEAAACDGSLNGCDLSDTMNREASEFDITCRRWS